MSPVTTRTSVEVRFRAAAGGIADMANQIADIKETHKRQAMLP